MKKIILALVIIISFSTAIYAQPSKMKMKEKPKMAAMKEGVMMMDNQVMLCSYTKCKPLTSTYTCKDGCTVSTDGTVTKTDGSTMKLKNGYQIDKNGNVAMIPHGQKGHVCGPDCPMYKKM